MRYAVFVVSNTAGGPGRTLVDLFALLLPDSRRYLSGHYD
jgi:hypothetical protein